ncbi:MAG: heme o synthase [Planctomyces sp.]|jgi:protoheme IX farnesyltransferase
MSAVAGQADTVGLSISGRWSDYLQMSRPRILVMSAVAVLAGYVLASPVIDWLIAAIAVFGILCLVAASSVLNQVWEAGRDARMRRTTGRPVASGRISRFEGVCFGVALAVLGGVVLWWCVNPLTSVASVLTMLCYVLVYTPLKPYSALCTTVGAVPGAMPGVLGWFAAGGSLGAEALALFAVFFVWQFPHFLAIGWIYRNEYEQAGLRMLPSFSDGGWRTGIVALVYAVLFVPVACLPRYAGLAGGGYLAASLVLSSGYLWLTWRFFCERTDGRARQLMAGSLICLPVLLICLVFDFLRLTV